MRNDLWTREEMLLTLHLYFKLPFGRMHGRDPEVKHLATLIDRTPGAIAMRLGNFAHIDPFHIARGIKGLANGRRQCEPIWNEFQSNREELIFECERILAFRENQKIELKYRNLLEDLPDLVGEENIREMKVRVNQSIFRQIVLANYNSTCAISGITIPQLLIASHVVPWSINKDVRMNPENGICLSAIHDRAFDAGLIGINTDLRLLLSPELKEHKQLPFFDHYFGQFEGKPMTKAQKYLPRKEFLEYHLNNIFID